MELERLKNKTALIVDASAENRETLRQLLQDNLHILESDSVDQAISMIESDKYTLDIILLDVDFPEKSGFDVLEFLHDHHYLDETPVIIITSDARDATVERSFQLGAIDFIRRPFLGRVLLRRVLTTVHLYQNKKDLVQLIDDRYETSSSQYDDLTGLYIKKVFFDEASQYLLENSRTGMCMVAIDIDHFKLYNQFYGRVSGDKYLKYLSKCLQKYVKEYGGIAGYAGADSFYYLCPDDLLLFSEMTVKIKNELRSKDLEIGFAPKLGVYRIEEDEKTILDICDCALSALANIRGEYSEIMAWYDPTKERSVDDFMMLREVEYGIRNHEFTFFLQPKCDMTTQKIVGAEALVRWFKQDKKLVNPNTFVPVLERNGLIFTLDRVVWEEVCKWQRYCIDMEYPLLPISVNVSRADIISMDVAAYLHDLIKKYSLPTDCIELEITESAYVSDTAGLKTEINRFKELGFKVLMDDFGSGYSSLNSLKDLDIDILKIDMRFLNMDFSTMEKGVSILESIVNMATSLEMPIVVEGVETDEQVRFLKEMGVKYAQGFFYYKPMDKERYEQLLDNPDNFDLSGIHMSEVEQVHMLDLTEEKLFTDEMINNILGAVAFYEVQDGVVRLLRLNEQYYKMMGMSEIMTDPEYAIHLRSSIHEDDRDTFFHLFEKADEQPLRGSTADIRYIHKDKSVQWIRVRIFSLKHHHNANLYYGSLEDITEIYSQKLN